MSKTLKPKVMIVDDDAVTRHSLRLPLENYCAKLYEAKSSEDMFRQLDTCNPHVIILDYLLPGLNGIAALRLLREHSDVGVIMISVQGDRQNRLSALRDGADDYIQKPLDEQELILKVIRVGHRFMHAKGESTDNQLFRVGDLVVSPDDRQLHHQAQPEVTETLTQAELICLTLMHNKAGKTCQRSGLHMAISGLSAVTTTPRTVDTIVGRLRAKIARFEVGISIETVRGEGYRLLTHDMTTA